MRFAVPGPPIGRTTPSWTVRLRPLVGYLAVSIISIFLGVSVVRSLVPNSSARVSTVLSEPCSAPATGQVFYDGAGYRRKTLKSAFLAVGDVLGTGRVARDAGCVRDNAQVRVFGLDRFPPRVALSQGGSSRRLLVRVRVCLGLKRDRAFLRCLARAHKL